MRELPIEIDDIVAQITAMGVQDEVYFFQDEEMDPTRLRGAFRQFTRHGGVYSDPILVTHIAYAARTELPWQRVIAAKELVHLFDAPVAKTDTEEETNKLLDRLVGPLSSDDYDISDLQAAKDRLALYQALPLLFPEAAIQDAKAAIASGSRSIEEVRDWACIPIEFVTLMLSEEWQTLNGVLGVLD